MIQIKKALLFHSAFFQKQVICCSADSDGSDRSDSDDSAGCSGSADSGCSAGSAGSDCSGYSD